MHAAPLQWKGEQACRPGGLQVPAPSQVPAVSTWSPLQTGARQTVSTAYSAQLPVPSQAPVIWQLDAPWS
jgi:hypothetical protein